MTLTDVLAQARHALVAHRLRAALSSIGIVFGIATVVAALAIGEGTRRAAFDEIASLGIDNLFVRAIRAEPSKDTRRLSPAPDLTLDDERAVARMLIRARSVAALRTARGEVRADTRYIETLVVGATVSWQDIVEAVIARGRWLTERDEDAKSRVAVVGAGLARTLFGSGDPVGRHVLAHGNWYQVIGVLRDRVQSPSSSSARQPIQAIHVDTALIVPISALDVRLGEGDRPDRIEQIAIRVSSADEVERASVAAASVLARRHVGPLTYELVVPREILRARLRAQRTFDGVLLAIGGLALLISGIGIMNIMLASVAERTHEIGVRRAFGARRREVIAQFAAEAALLCVAGGVVGVPVGVVLSALVAVLAGWPVSISAGAIGLALLLATVVGLIFGVYPARLASQIQPVDALRAP